MDYTNRSAAGKFVTSPPANAREEHPLAADPAPAAYTQSILTDASLDNGLAQNLLTQVIAAVRRGEPADLDALQTAAEHIADAGVSLHHAREGLGAHMRKRAASGH